MFQIERVNETDSTVRALQVLGDHRAEEADDLPSVGRGELESVPGQVESYWPNADVPVTLLRRAVREGLESDLFLGTRPETYSPLGEIRPDSFGRFRSRAQESPARLWTRAPYVSDLDIDVNPDRDSLLPSGAGVVRMRTADQTVGAMSFSFDCAIVPIDTGTESIEIRYTADTDTQRFELNRILDVLGSEIPNSDITPILLWRLYIGGNSTSIDGATEGKSGLHRIAFGLTRSASILVARMVFAVHAKVSKSPGDPTARERLVSWEHVYNDLARESPDLREIESPVRSAVVVVHGTMSCGIPLVAGLKESLDFDVPVLRFEHDTWIPVHENSDELVRELRRLQTEHILFVAHSRGGLVTRQAIDELAKLPANRISQVTLGSPFMGTPIVSAVSTGLLGVRALLGALRLAGGPIVDVATRLAGFLIKPLPRGISAMDPKSDLIKAYRDKPKYTIAFAGDADPYGSRENYAAAIDGFLGVAFKGEPNDFFVACESAGAQPDCTKIVYCDHFSYLLEKDVVQTIMEAAQGLPAEAEPIRMRPDPAAGNQDVSFALD